MSYRAEVIADRSGKWAGNGLTFATEGEAVSYVYDLRGRWFSVSETRTVKGRWAVTHRWNPDARKAEALDE